MKNTRSITIPFPYKGVVRTGSYAEQPEFTTPDALNIWPIDSPTGRVRGGVRPGLDQIGTVSGTPYAQCPVNYLNAGSLFTGAAITTSDGTYLSTNGTTWTTNPITQNPGTDFATCAIFGLLIYQAAGGANCRQATLPTGSEANLSNAGGGTAPTNCGIVLAHANRLWLMGDTTNRHVLYASAVGDATDWDYADITSGGAFTNSGAEGGRIGEPIVAGLSHDNVNLLIGCTDSIYYLSGNPRVGGVRSLSSFIGPLQQSAWCQDDKGNTWMMTRLGLYVIQAGTPSEPQPISAQAIPNNLIGYDPANGDRVVVGYDHRFNGIHIFCNPNSGTSEHWFYHLPTKSFWPQAFSIDVNVAVSMPKMMNANDTGLLAVSTGGSVRQFDRTNTEEFDSRLVLPIPLGNDFSEGILHMLQVVLAENSEAVNAKVYTGDGWEEAYANYEADSAAFTLAQITLEGLNYVQHIRARGHCCYVKIYDVSDEQWLIEKIIGEVGYAGRRRVG